MITVNLPMVAQALGNDSHDKVRITKGEHFDYQQHFPLSDLLDIIGLVEVTRLMSGLPELGALGRQFAAWCIEDVIHRYGPESLRPWREKEAHRAEQDPYFASQWATGAASQAAYDANPTLPYYDHLAIARLAVVETTARQEAKLRQFAAEWLDPETQGRRVVVV